MIEIRDISCSYGEKLIVDKACAVFKNGEVTAIIGPNGSGKSTLIETVIGLHEEFEGKILIDGEDASSMSSVQRARKVAYMSQNRTIPRIVARKMVMHGRFPHLGYPKKYRKEDIEIARASLRRVGAEYLSERPMTDMSGGQRQKIYIAMALAQTTPHIFMDEPTNFLDVRNQQELMDLARSMADDQKAVIMVLHDIRSAMESADHILVLNDGKLVADGSAEAVFESGILDEVFGIRLNRFETASGWRYYYE